MYVILLAGVSTEYGLSPCTKQDETNIINDQYGNHWYWNMSVECTGSIPEQEEKVQNWSKWLEAGVNIHIIN